MLWKFSLAFAIAYVSTLALFGREPDQTLIGRTWIAARANQEVTSTPPVCDPSSGDDGRRSCREIAIDDDAPNDIDRTSAPKKKDKP